MRRRDCLKILAGTAPALLAFRRANAEDPALDVLEARLGGGFSGVIAYGIDHAPPVVRPRGWADAEGRVPAGGDTAFALGSVSKWFATTTVLRLAGEGRIDIDIPITRYLPDFRRETGDRVTVRLLLANRSGIPDGVTQAARTDATLRQSALSAGEVVARYAQGDFAFEPDTRFDYSLTNWVILRALLEAHMDQDFVALVRRSVLDPLSLDHTGVAEQGFEAVSGMAAAYGGLEPPIRKMQGAPGFAAASGVFYSSAADLVRTARTVFGSEFLSEKSRREMVQVRSPEEGYALGGRVRRIGDRMWAWETGRIAAYRCHVAHALEGPPRTFVVLNNTDMDQSKIGDAVIAAAEA